MHGMGGMGFPSENIKNKSIFLLSIRNETELAIQKIILHVEAERYVRAKCIKT